MKIKVIIKIFMPVVEFRRIFLEKKYYKVRSDEFMKVTSLTIKTEPQFKILVLTIYTIDMSKKLVACLQKTRCNNILPTK